MKTKKRTDELENLIKRGTKLDEDSTIYCVIPDKALDFGFKKSIKYMDSNEREKISTSAGSTAVDIYPEFNMIVLEDATPQALSYTWIINKNILVKVESTDGVDAIMYENIKQPMKRKLRIICSATVAALIKEHFDSYIEFDSEFTMTENGIISGITTPYQGTYDIWREPVSNLKKYQWFKYYVEPGVDVEINKKHIELFWYYISERLKIYHNRVVLGNPYPWTDDIILQQYRFTNICRDMDKMSIYEINHILKKLDEPVDDLLLRKKSVMANIMLYRTFVNIPSYEAFGFIDLADKDWEKKWAEGSDRLLKRREQGESIFSSSFMTNNLHGANKDPNTNWNKAYNGICMARYFFDNIDKIWEACVTNCSGMEDQLIYLRQLPGVGDFTAYEFACSIAMADRYCKNRLVPWDQDNYTSAGPGSKRGMDSIFINRGNLSYVDAIIYLRSIWEHEMKRLGYYDEFVAMLPKQLKGDIDLRVIEHCLCEFSKYIRVYYRSGSVKRRFSYETHDLNLLKL